MSFEILEDVKTIFTCDRCGKREVVSGRHSRPQMGYKNVSIIIQETETTISGKVDVIVCTSCANELKGLAERFFDESNKEGGEQK